MIKTHEREKLINAMVFFAENTRHCGKIKLFKLLYLLDFEHFKETGRPVTGMEYRAWEKGPVPHELWCEWPAMQRGSAANDIANAIDIVPESTGDYELQKVVPLIAFHDDHFTRRELRIMRSLVERFRDERTKPLINFTHQLLGPWEVTWRDGQGNNESIDYALAVGADDPYAAEILEAAAEFEAVKAVLGVVH